MQLNGRTAVVTGAGGALGLAVARRLAEAGARVMLTDPDDEALAAALQALKGEAGEVARFFCPLEDKLTVQNLMAATQDAFGRIDILVAAQRMTVIGDVLALGPDDFDRGVGAELRSLFLLTQAAAKRMVAEAEADRAYQGAMVFVSSTAAERSVPELMTHSVVSAAVNQMARAMATALAPHRIRVNAVALGSVMTNGLREKVEADPTLRAQLVRVTPLERLGSAAEAAEAVAFLASPAASFVTGQVLAVDGGRGVLDPLAAASG